VPGADSSFARRLNSVLFSAGPVALRSHSEGVPLLALPLIVARHLANQKSGFSAGHTGNDLEPLAGTDTFRGCSFQAAYAVSLAADVLEGRAGSTPRA
jgi:hypothetical protein